MREIKFRAWEDQLGMFYVNPESDNTLLFGNEKPILQMHCSDGVFDYFNVNNLMQFTGLLDKEGKEIYEGDIIHHISTRSGGYQRDGDDIYKKIVFGPSNPGCNSVTDYIGFWAVHLNAEDLECGSSIAYYINCGMVVIGNIYESKDLLNTTA